MLSCPSIEIFTCWLSLATCWAADFTHLLTDFGTFLRNKSKCVSLIFLVLHLNIHWSLFIVVGCSFYYVAIIFFLRKQCQGKRQATEKMSSSQMAIVIFAISTFPSQPFRIPKWPGIWQRPNASFSNIFKERQRMFYKTQYWNAKFCSRVPEQ